VNNNKNNKEYSKTSSVKIINIKTTTESETVGKAVEVLRNGGLVVYPTETLYGIGADATNQEAVNKLLKYKARREGKPLSIACADRKMAGRFVHINKTAENIYRTLLPGPVTVVSRSRGNVAKGVESELGTLGIRIPDYPLILKIIQAFGKPITSTSANASYKKRPYNINDIVSNISARQKKLIDLVLDAGQLPIREPSTVVDTTLNDTVVLRQGEIQFTSHTVIQSLKQEDTIAVGTRLMNQYKQYLGFKSVIFALQGNLGAGKTQFAKGVAQALGVKERVISPTFILERDYAFKHGSKTYTFIHIDTWRMFSGREFLDLGFAKLIGSGAVFAIEWAEKVSDILKQYSDEAKIIWVKIEYGKQENERTIEWSDAFKTVRASRIPLRAATRSIK